MIPHNDLQIVLEKMIVDGLVERVIRPDGDIGYKLTSLGQQHADDLLYGQDYGESQ